MSEPVRFDPLPYLSTRLATMLRAGVEARDHFQAGDFEAAIEAMARMLAVRWPGIGQRPSVALEGIKTCLFGALVDELETLAGNPAHEIAFPIAADLRALSAQCLALAERLEAHRSNPFTSFGG